MGHCDLGEVRLFFTEDGSGDPPILLIHGWTCDSHDWSWQFDAFTGSHRVVAVDLRGHGRSSTPSSGYKPATMAADLAGLVRSLGLPPVVAVGHSMGALVASALAVEYPELVRAVVAVDPAYGLAGEVAAAVPALCDAMAVPGGLDVVATVLGGMEGSDTSAALRNWHRRRVLGMDQEVVAACARGMYKDADQFGLRQAASDYLRKRSCPTLAVWVSAEAAQWEQSLMDNPSDKCVNWSGAGHWLHQERPEEFNELVLSWVRVLPDAVTGSGPNN